MRLADEVADGTRSPVGAESPFAEIEQRVDRAAITHLVVEAGERDVVAVRRSAVRSQQSPRHDEQRDTLDAGRRARDLGQHQVHDVLGDLVLAGGDPHLVAEQPVAGSERRIAIGLRARRDVGQRRARLRLRQAHRAGKPAGEHRSHECVDLRGRAVRKQQVRIGGREQRIPGAADVRREHVRETGLVDGGRQLHAAELVVLGGSQQPRFSERVEGRLRFRDQVDALAVELGLLDVALAAMRQEDLGRDALRRIERRVEGLTRVIGKSRPVAQRGNVEPFVQQELEIAARKQLGSHPCIIPATGGGRRWRRVPGVPARRASASFRGRW